MPRRTLLERKSMNLTTISACKKVICYIFGHLPYTYNCGSFECPEQAWGCSYCDTELTYGDEHWGLNLNNRVTKWLQDRELQNYKNTLDEDEIPF